MDSLDNTHIMMVEDDAFIRRIFRHILSSLGIKITEAISGQQAIAALSTHQVELIITDIQMPRMNGLELIRQIRCGNTDAPRNQRVIVITSLSNSEVLGTAINLNINGFLVKPITPAMAQNKISIALTEELTIRPEIFYEQINTNLDNILQATKKSASLLKPLRSEGSKGSEGVTIPLQKLKSGMQLYSALQTKSGFVILPAGQVLNDNMVKRIIELIDTIEGTEAQIEKHL